jgi:hypothetical protein
VRLCERVWRGKGRDADSLPEARGIRVIRDTNACCRLVALGINTHTRCARLP